MNRFQKKLLIILIAMAVLTPLGIYLPARFNAGDAWGEWSAETIQKMIGFVPEKLQKAADLWKAPIPDYSLGNEQSTFTARALSYILSAAIGIVLCVLVLLGLSRLLVKRKE